MPDKAFGKRLQHVRRDVLGFRTVEAFAAFLGGPTVSTIQKWEGGTSYPSGDAPWRLFKLLGPALFDSLMPDLMMPSGAVKVPQEDGGPDLVVVPAQGSKAERLAALVRLAAEVAAEDD